jgi:hypothetical protein
MDLPEHRAEPHQDETGAQTMTPQWYAYFMGKRQDQRPLENNPFVEGFIDWIDSPEGELSSEVSDAVWMLLEKADLDAKHRKILWEDGKRLSITESVQRIHADYPDFPLETIEEHLIGWLEMEFAPPSYSQKQLDELDRLTEKWIDDHERQAEAPRKRGTTRHS